MRRILGLVGSRRQVQLFSATLDGAVNKLAQTVQGKPARHEVGPKGPDMSAAHHVFWEVAGAARADTTAAAIKAIGSTIVFCRTRHGADRLAKQLGRLGVSAAPIHGGRSQPQRDRASRSFAKGDVSSLIATDVAARGVHVEGVRAVVHFDPPVDATTYVHRSGRTARAGATGVVLSLVERSNNRAALASCSVTSASTLRSRMSMSPPCEPSTYREPMSRRPIGVAFAARSRSSTATAATGSSITVPPVTCSCTRAICSARAIPKGGEMVEFAVGEGRRGPEALDVRVLASA